MTITLVSGKPRNGKTLLVAYESLGYLDTGGKVHGNFSLFDLNGKGEWVKGKDGSEWSGKFHENFRAIGLYDLVLMFIGERCVVPEKIALQEWYGWLSSHKSLSDVNDLQAALVFQGGKLGYDFIGDSQVSKRVDNSVRILADYRYEAVRESVCDSVSCSPRCPNLAVCHFRYFTLDTDFPNEDVRTGDFFDIPFSFANLFWNRYDTWCRTLPVGLNQIVAKMAKLEPEIMDKVIESQVEKLLSKADEYGFRRGRRVTQIMVKDALLREREVPVFYAYVANRLELRL